MNDQQKPDLEAADTSKLLSLPSEILQAIFAAIQDTDIRNSKRDWFIKPENKFMGLLLTCKRFQHEIESFWPHYDVPFSKLPKFIDKYLSGAHRNPVFRMRRYRSVSLELDFQAADLTAIGRFLQEAQHLEELRLYFNGKDLIGTPVFLHGCGHNAGEGRETPLPPDAQRDSREMISLWLAILNLTKLRVLVVSNANFQLFQMVFQNKPRLQHVHLTADPRSVVHTGFNISSLGRLIQMPKEYFPPIKALQLSANSVLNASTLPSNVALTLQHLTWTVPCTSLGSNTLPTSHLQETDQLIQNLRLNARKLDTLRICIADKGYMWGGHRAYADIHAALTSTIAFLTTLKRYELHMTLGKDVWSEDFGEKIFMALPTGVRRLYASEKWITLRCLDRLITNKYLYAEKTGTQTPRNRHYRRSAYDQKLGRWVEMLASETKQHFLKKRLEETEYEIWINPMSYKPTYYSETDPSVGNLVIRKGDLNLFLPGIVGEDLRRTDYIPIHTGSLGFVAYTYEEEMDLEATKDIGETKTQWLLRLNGRLLDRERNSHLRKYAPGEHIPPKTEEVNSGPDNAETETRSAYHGIRLLLHALTEVEATNPRDVRAAQDELMGSPLTSCGLYFGNESEACKVFRAEPVVLVSQVQPYHYCEVSDVAVDHRCHWLCPEADVPTQAAWDNMCIAYREGKKAGA